MRSSATWSMSAYLTKMFSSRSLASSGHSMMESQMTTCETASRRAVCHARARSRAPRPPARAWRALAAARPPPHLVERVRLGRVFGHDKHEELLDVPVEGRRQIRARVEADQRAIDPAVRAQRAQAVELHKLDDGGGVGPDDQGAQPRQHGEHEQDGQPEEHHRVQAHPHGVHRDGIHRGARGAMWRCARLARRLQARMDQAEHKWARITLPAHRG